LDNPLRPFAKSLWAVFRDVLPRRAHVIVDQLRFQRRLPNLKHPATFSDKIAHRMLYDRDARIPELVDKISAKRLMAARFGEDFVIPTVAVFDSSAEVDFALLPYPCVIKPNHASGFNVFLHQRPEGEIKVRRKLNRLLSYRHERSAEEWAYSQIAPRLLVEPFLSQGDTSLTDYKFHTFAGRVFAIQVDVGRYTDHRRAFFDPAWKPMPFSLLYPTPSTSIPKPAALPDMIRFAQQIGEAFPYLRVDLYEIGDKVKFGEATFYPGAGLEVFKPREYDALFGAQWAGPQ
jgi:hypothetical protein